MRVEGVSQLDNVLSTASLLIDSTEGLKDTVRSELIKIHKTRDDLVKLFT